MRAQKEWFDRLMSEYYEPDTTNAEYYVSLLLTTSQRANDCTVEIACHLAQGILMPIDDKAPLNEKYGSSHGQITTLHWLNSKKLSGLLDKYWKTCKKDENYMRPYGFLNLKYNQMESPEFGTTTFTENYSGFFKLTCNKNHAPYKLVPNCEVSLHFDFEYMLGNL